MTREELDPRVLLAVLDLRDALHAARAGKASARRVGEARAVLDEVLCPGVAETGR